MNPKIPFETPPLKSDWETIAIGRHLVDVPGDAKLHQSWRYNDIKLERILIRSNAEIQKIVSDREAYLRGQPQRKHGQLFIERISLANDSIALLSWSESNSEFTHLCDTYFLAGTKAIKFSGETDPSRRDVAIQARKRMSTEWKEIDERLAFHELGIGYVAGDMLLAANRFNPESWELSIRLAGKPDVRFQVKAYAHSRTKPEGLRDRAGGALAGLLGTIAGLTQLRNRRRSVGPIEADEILVAGNQDGKRSYGFKWEAPGKGGSLAEPNLNVSLEVSESAYKTNAQSFANDQEALELWDTVVESIRLRPGAAG